jgi:2-amino-4-hydroxy-6-hydroxymethyldihydropteridine diphosphokinase
MSSCLVALGSNLGDREATLEAALAALATAPSTQLRAHSSWYRSRPVGMAESNREFLNGAALVDTALEPAAFWNVLRSIESEHGRRHDERWSDRTLDLDLLLVDDRVFETPELIVPHPRMSFRRFVLEPADQIAGDLIHPVLGWTIGHLRNQLDTGADLVAIVWRSLRAGQLLAASLVRQRGMELAAPPLASDVARLWPPERTIWLRVARTAEGHVADAGTVQPKESSFGTAHLPKLTLLLDVSSVKQPSQPELRATEEPETSGEAVWASLVRLPGRGPTLCIRQTDPLTIEREAFAAVQAVWPHLGP